jgi:thymidylate kinase
LGAAYVKTPPVAYNTARQFVADCESSSASFYFYLSALYSLQSDLAPYHRTSALVIVDRYLHSTIAYHAGGTSFVPPAFDSTGLLIAELTIRIWLQRSERLHRKTSRGFHIFDRNVVDEEAIDSYFAEVCDLSFENNRSLDESVDALATLVRGRLPEQE